jgi:tripartite-type tricarboxylate transporter receptor subunit TctC
MLSRRRFVGAATLAGVAAHMPSLTTGAAAQAVAKPARLLVGFPSGGAPDLVARLLAEQMKGYAPALIVDNRTGAGGRIALEALKGSEADGSVMALTPLDQLTLFPHIYSRLGYKPLEDFAPVATVCSVQFLLAIGPRVPPNVRVLRDFIAWCRENPPAAFYGTAGAGTHPHFIGMALAQATGLEFSHAAYKGGVAAVQDVLGGHLAACISTIGTLLPSVRSGVLRASATTAPRRSVALPDVPTFAEEGYPMLESMERFRHPSSGPYACRHCRGASTGDPRRARDGCGQGGAC